MINKHPEAWEERILEHLLRSGRIASEQIQDGTDAPDRSLTDLWGPRIQRLIDDGILLPEEVISAQQAMAEGDRSKDLSIWAPTDPNENRKKPADSFTDLESTGRLTSLASEDMHPLRVSREVRPWERTRLIGAQVGNIRIVDLIDQGGMGQVFEGYDEKLGRVVAVKCIHAEHRLHPKAKARFLREAQILSQLAHPNICQVFEYIEGENNDFLVLERIQGQTLKQALKQKLTPERAFQIAEELAGVLSATHGKGIVHRDLKPTNIMLIEDGPIKVLDFGLARFLQEERERSPHEVPHWGEVRQSSTEKGSPTKGPGSAGPTPSVFPDEASQDLTRDGAILGTPGYMSPEQARGESASSACDMYAFGVILQQIFTGESPVSPIPHASQDEALNGILPKASSLDPDLRALLDRLRSPEPANRPSALDAAEKLAWIRQKPKRKRKQRSILASILTLIFLAGGLAMQTFRAMRANKEARKEAETARLVSEFMVRLFQNAGPRTGEGKEVTARELLDKGVQKIDQEMVDQPIIQASFKDAMGIAYAELGLFKKAEPLLLQALSLREKHLPPDHLNLAISLLNVGNIYETQAKYAEALPLLRRSLEIHEKILGPEHTEVAECLSGLGTLFMHQGQYQEAEPILQRCLAISEKNAYSAKHTRRDLNRLAMSLNNLGNLYYRQKQYNQAKPLWLRSLQIREKLYGPENPDLATGQINLGLLLATQKKYDEAERYILRATEIYQRAFGSQHTLVGMGILNLGILFMESGKLEHALSRLLHSLDIFEKNLGPLHPRVASNLYYLSCCHARLGQHQKALDHLQRAVAMGGKAPWKQGLETEPQLKSLYGDSQFQKIVAQTKASLKEGQP